MAWIESAATFALLTSWIAPAAVVPAASAATGPQGSATVRVVIEPPLAGAHRFVFTGSPAGGLTVRPGKIGRVTAAPVAAGRHDSKLVQIDPDVEEAGYSLTAIRCDDAASAEPSSGDVELLRASLHVESGETVTCDFVFAPAPASPTDARQPRDRESDRSQNGERR